MSGEDANVDSLDCLVVTVAVILAALSLAPPVLNLPPSPTEETLAIIVVLAKLLLPVVQFLAVGVQRALPVPGLVEVDGVDGEVAHVVKAGALHDDFKNIQEWKMNVKPAGVSAVTRSFADALRRKEQR